MVCCPSFRIKRRGWSRLSEKIVQFQGNNLLQSGGERGIRTPETVARLHTFQACAFSHSATSPQEWRTIAMRGPPASGCCGTVGGAQRVRFRWLTICPEIRTLRKSGVSDGPDGYETGPGHREWVGAGPAPGRYSRAPLIWVKTGDSDIGATGTSPSGSLLAARGHLDRRLYATISVETIPPRTQLLTKRPAERFVSPRNQAPRRQENTDAD
jgi:hypothetical protein